MCQLNWWMPIYPVEANNAMAFYPRYFGEEVKNNSEIYNYYEWNTNNRASAAKHIKSDTREQPKPQQQLEPVRVSYLPPPGGLILFAGAQLHETVPNTAGVARYSIDFRTVHVDDVHAGVGAPVADVACTGTALRDFKRLTDGASFTEDEVAPYDSESAAGAAGVKEFVPTS